MRLETHHWRGRVQADHAQGRREGRDMLASLLEAIGEGVERQHVQPARASRPGVSTDTRNLSSLVERVRVLVPDGGDALGDVAGFLLAVARLATPGRLARAHVDGLFIP